IFGFHSISLTSGGSVGEEIPVFQVSARRKVGEAAGDKLRRDTVQQIKYIPSIDSYISCSLKGSLAVWSMKLRLQACIDIHEPVWTTSCDYLPGLRRVLCSTERSLVLWDNRAKGTSQGLFLIKPIEDAPQCVTVVPTSDDQQGDTVLYGDDQGYVNLLTILPQDLAIKHSKQERKSDLSENHFVDPKNLTKGIIRKRIHQAPVIKVKYFPSLKCFASCSANSSKSFALENVDRIFLQNKEPRCVAIRKGVNCFDLCVRANIIATAGVDKIIRLWHPHIFSRPSGKLIGHLFTISDMTVNETDQHIISLSTARIFRIWDIHTLTCLQVFTDNEERPGDRRIYSIAFDHKNERLLSGSSVIDSWPLSRTIKDSPPVPLSHDRPIVQMLLNKEFSQLVSVCSLPVIKVWELETGHLAYSIKEPHGPNIEVTCMALDKICSKLISAGNDGSLKIWDFGSGQMVKSRMTMTSYGLSELSVSSLVCTSKQNETLILASTKSKILVYLDSPQSTRILLIQELSHLLDLPKDIATTGSFISDGYYRISRTELRAERSFGQQTLSSTKSELTSLEEETVEHMTASERHLQKTSSNGARDKTHFPVTKLLPDIGSAQNVHQTPTCHVTSMTPVGLDMIATGYSNGTITIWDAERLVIKSKQIAASQNGELADQVNQITIMIYKSRYLRRSTAQQTANHLSASLANHRSRQRRVGRTEFAQVSLPQTEHESLSPLNVMEKLIETAAESKITSGIKKQNPDMDLNKDPEEEFRENKQNSNFSDVKSDLQGAGSTSSLSSPARTKSTQVIKDPILVSVHQSSMIRFWGLNGELCHEIQSVTPKANISVTAVCFNSYTQYLYTGNAKGYVIVWDVNRFLQDPSITEPQTIKQTLCWKAHVNKIINLVVVEASNLILSSSVDGSIRVWLATTGSFIGFFGQIKSFHISTSEELQKNSVLPFDISEGPIAPVEKTKSIPKIIIRQKFEYPLIFAPSRWEPFHRSAYNDDVSPNSARNMGDKKFFAALMKPKAYNYHLKSYITADQKSGAVFRSLPVYSVPYPEITKNIATSFNQFQDDVALLGTNQITLKTNKRKNKDGNIFMPPKLPTLPS
ncbi:WD repeat-containing protein 64, partial [Bulinus truncatus]